VKKHSGKVVRPSVSSVSMLHGSGENLAFGGLQLKFCNTESTLKIIDSFS